MSPNDHVPRRYSDDEVGEILRRATEYQQEDPSSRGGDGSGAGMTLAELQEIAMEAGIDPSHLQRAAASLDRPVDSGWGTVLAGSPMTISVERVVPGELTPDDFARIVPEVQRVAVGHGNATMVGSTMTWSSETAQKQRSLQVTVSSDAGETLIRAEERLHGLAGALYGGIVGGAGTGIGVGLGMPLGLEVIGSVAFAVAFPVAIISACYLTARTILKHTGDKRRKALEGLVDHIARQVKGHGPDALASGEVPTLPPGGQAPV